VWKNHVGVVHPATYPNKDVSFPVKHAVSYFHTIKNGGGLLSDEECVENEYLA
jgi:hypothetical protein